MKFEFIGNAPFALKLPKGYRWVRVGEKTKYGDLYAGNNDWEKTTHPDRKITRLMKRFYIRKLDK